MKYFIYFVFLLIAGELSSWFIRQFACTAYLSIHEDS